MTTIKDIREKQGLTQVQLAEKSGIKQNTISDLETGNIKSPSLDTAVKLARALGVAIEELFPEQETAPCTK
jgi:transcriptional regulator with XRE-family HTH domain